jgi:histidine triad (HIT) family protein
VRSLKVESVNSVELEDEPVLGHLFTVARQIAAQEKMNQTGYRLIINTGHYGGQSVYHLHMHLLGGKRMSIPLV